MFKWEINGRLVVAVIAVSMSFSFSHDQSTPIHFKDFPELKKFSIQESFSTDKTMDKLHVKLFKPITEDVAWYTVSRIVGLISGWPVAEFIGRKQGVLYSSSFRLIAIMMQLSLTVNRQSYLSYSDIEASEENITTDLNSTTISPEELLEREAAVTRILVTSKIIDGFYSGLSTFLGIIYIYEISPKSSSKIGSLPVMAFYLLLKSSFDYIASFIMVYYDPTSDSLANTTAILGLVHLFVGILQMALVLKFCPESPSFLVVQHKSREKAKQVLKNIRATDNVDEELDLLEMDQNKANSLLRRAMLLVSLYLVYAIHNWIFLFVAFLQTLQFGIPVNTCINFYLVTGILSYLLPLLYFENSDLHKLKLILFRCYGILGLTYFAHSFMTTINHHVSLYSFHNNEHIVVAAIQVLVSLATIIAFSSGPGIITLILINEYSCQSNRSKYMVISWVLGNFVTYKIIEIFAGIFTKALLYVYVFTTWPWVALGIFTWFVWKFETKGYSDGNGNFQENRNPPLSTSEITVVEKSESETAM